MVACMIIVSTSVPFLFLWIMDFGFWTLIWNLDFGLGFGTGLGLDKKNMYILLKVKFSLFVDVNKCLGLYLRCIAISGLGPSPVLVNSLSQNL